MADRDQTHNLRPSIRIPSSLIDTYVRYRRGTEAIVYWLCQITGFKTTSETITITDMLKLSQIVLKKKVPLSDLIDFHFRETIAARSQLSKHFRRSAADSQDIDTINHEFFTLR